MSIPLDFFENADDEEKNVGEEDMGAQVPPSRYCLALTQKGKIQFICDGRKYQVKSQSPAACAPGEQCVMKLYCAYKGCQVSAFVNRTVQVLIGFYDLIKRKIHFFLYYIINHPTLLQVG